MKIEFIIPTYNRPHHLMSIINSIFAQTNPNWFIHVVADCPPKGSLDKIIDYFKDSNKINWTILETRNNDWGHTPRNIGLQNAKEDWVIMTGEDNYYTPIFVDSFLKEVNTPRVHFVYCDMIHNWVNNEYKLIKCKPKWGNIDIGNFMIKTEFGKQLSLNPKIESADGVFVEEYIKKFPQGTVKYIPKPLYVHN